MEQYELQHHGIKGMKWGIRRFQKLTGGLTAAGKKRYAKKAGDDDDENTSEEHKSARSKSVKNMSNDELRKSLERLRMEDEYNQRTATPKSKGRQFVEGVLMETGKKTASSLLSATINTGLAVGLNRASAKMNADMAKISLPPTKKDDKRLKNMSSTIEIFNAMSKSLKLDKLIDKDD